MLATMGALIHSAGGSGPLFSQPNTVHGKDFSLAWLTGFAALQGNWSTLSVNSSDFSRYSKSPRAVWSQGLAIPISVCLLCPFNLSDNQHSDSLACRPSSSRSAVSSRLRPAFLSTVSPLRMPTGCRSTSCGNGTTVLLSPLPRSPGCWPASPRTSLCVSRSGFARQQPQPATPP